MTEVTVEKLADIVGAPVDRLLKQMQEAGLEQKKAEDSVSDKEKQVLLAFLKESHGGSGSAPKKITLKRKTTTTLKAAGSSGRTAKTVNVEVRKRRTYVKRSAVEAKDSAERLEKAFVEEAEEAEKAAELAAQEEAARLAEEQKKAEEEALLAKQAEAEKPPAEAIAVQEAATAKDAGVKHKRAAPAAPEPSEKEKEKAKEKRLKKAAKPKNAKAWIQAAVEDDDFEEETPQQPKQAASTRKAFVAPKLAKPTKFLKAHGFAKPAGPMTKEVSIPEQITVSELAQRMSIKGGVVIKALMKMGVMATINQDIDQDSAVLIVEEMGHKAVLEEAVTIETELMDTLEETGDAAPRAPVVTVMGHVDHGKTSLLDYIRKTQVTAGESGGITQHIGAYQVKTDKGVVTFLDTPGHAAFTAMRARGAQLTDIVILVVAADDGVMPQTEEAILHARSAGVPLVVAVNKIDREAADIDRVKNELAAKEVIPEDWGGDVQFMPVSAITGQGIEELLEAVLLQAELLELTAVVDTPAKGVVVESSLDKGRGAIATLLVQGGTLKQGDMVLAGGVFGRARALLDENSKPIKEAGPSVPVAVLGLASTPEAGDDFIVAANERQAREVAEFRQAETKAAAQAKKRAVQLENLFASMGEGEVKNLNIVLKTDVRGTLEALSSALEKLGNDEVKVALVSGGVGGISETDASLAASTGAVMVGFNVRADSAARKVVEKHGLDLRYYSVIYDIVDDVKKALVGMLAPAYKEEIVGIAEVRDVFTSPKFGQIAGCMVIEGTVHRNKPIRVLREDVVIYEGELESLRRFKDDANEVRNGMECGIGVKNYNDVRAGDKIEVFDLVEVERTL